MGNYEELLAFQISYGLAKNVFIVSKGFPKEELFGLTNQIRRSSRSVPVNIVEAYRKRCYPKHFISKLSDADGECSETLIWLRMARDFGYLDEDTFTELYKEFERVGCLLGVMMKNPEKFYRPPTANGQPPTANPDKVGTSLCSAANGQPPTANGQPPIPTRSGRRFAPRLTANGQRPTANGQRLTANGQRPTANGQRPTANGQRSTANGQPPTANGQPPTANGT